MGIALSLAGMLCFAANILLTRYAVVRLPVAAGFFIVLATNILFPALLFGLEFAVRRIPYEWNWKSAGLFALGGLVGLFMRRGVLFDTVVLLRPPHVSASRSQATALSL